MNKSNTFLNQVLPAIPILKRTAFFQHETQSHLLIFYTYFEKSANL